MGTLAETVRNALLDSYFGSGNPATIYVAAWTAGGEAAGGGYARVAVANNAVNFPAAAGGAKSNGAEITFPEATGDWGTVTELRLYSAGSGGTELGAHTLATAKAITTGDTLKVPTGGLTVTASNPA